MAPKWRQISVRSEAPSEGAVLARSAAAARRRGSVHIRDQDELAGLLGVSRRRNLACRRPVTHTCRNVSARGSGNEDCASGIGRRGRAAGRAGRSYHAARQYIPSRTASASRQKSVVLVVGLDPASRGWTTLRHHVQVAQHTCRAQGGQGNGEEGSREQRRMRVRQCEYLRAAAHPTVLGAQTRACALFGPSG